LEGLSPPMLPCGNGTGLNFPHDVDIEILQKATIIASSKTEQSTVSNWKGFALAFFITK